ncbi:MAG: DNA primase DnaG [Halobacteria archaeon]|nr:DNA primase DnaG [Halobacteria archaeon]
MGLTLQASDTTKYFIHANLRADGVVERSDVVGAVFGQTEGLLGDDLDLRDLQKASKISRMEVDVRSENWMSYGTITIGSSLDKVETAVLAASLETIERVGPCTADVEIEMVEDVRTTKRKKVVERAKYILSELFDDSSMDSQEILDEVRETVRANEITNYAGLPAGPNVEESDAILIVEGRADVLNLLKYGIKNAIGVEGTDVPDEIGELSQRKTVTTFLDSDRGGELILRELSQVAEVDYVARAPEGRCVEDLSQKEVTKALRDKMPYSVAVEGEEDEIEGEIEDEEPVDEETGENLEPEPEEPEIELADEIDEDELDGNELAGAGGTQGEGALAQKNGKGSFVESLEDVRGTEKILLLDKDKKEITEVDEESLKQELEERNGEIRSLVVDGSITQRTLDIASTEGIETVVGEKKGHIAKKPLDVNIVTEAEL